MRIIPYSYCCICGREINGRYLYDRWGNRCCSKHDAKLCECCGKIIADGQQRLCPACRTKRVLSTDSLKPQVILAYVKSKMKQFGLVIPKDNVDISIVGEERLSQLSGSPIGSTTGLTSSCGFAKNWTHHIYMLDGMSMHLYRETLAHECTHVWLNEHNSPLNKSSLAELEGFCNLVAYKVLLFDDSFESQNIRERMLADPSPIYGEGFRMMKARAEQMGWNQMLSSVS